jgi:hypothetical protein
MKNDVEVGEVMKVVHEEGRSASLVFSPRI